VNFAAMMFTLKGKLINWSTNKLSFTRKILVSNQVLLASIWYLAACWNPNPKMCDQIRGLIRNFIWRGKEAPARAKVRWDTLTLPTSQRGLDVTNPKVQLEALLAKLFIRGLNARRRALEKACVTQCGQDVAPDPRQRLLKSQLALASHRT